MAQFLHRLGILMFRHPWRVLAAWAIILAILGFTASQFIRPTTSAISIPGTEAQKAIDRLEHLFKDSGGSSGRIVFESKNGDRITSQQQQITSVMEEIKQVGGVSQVISPFADASFIAKSGTIAYAQVQLKGESGSVSQQTIDGVMKKLNELRSNNLEIEVGGDLISHVPGEIIGVGEIGGVAIALMVLVITFGSLIAAGMPLVSALTAVAVSMTGLFTMSQLFEIGSTTPVLAVMLGLAVGIDYSLFIINKYRTYLLKGHSHQDATAWAVSTAGNAVVFAAITVIIALAALSVVAIPFMTTMGLVGAGSIAISAVVAITLTPALLRLAGGRVASKKLRRSIDQAQIAKRRKGNIDKNTIWYKWGVVLAKRPVISLIFGLIIVGVVAFPSQYLLLGLPTDQYAAKESTQRKAYDLLAKGFGAGFNAPLTVVVEGLPKVSAADKASMRTAALKELDSQIAAATASQQAEIATQAAQVTTAEQQLALEQKISEMKTLGERQKQEAVAKIDNDINKYAQLIQLKKVSDEVAKLSNVRQALPATTTPEGSAGVIQVIPKTAPADQKTAALIAELRDSATQKKVTKSNNVTFAVTGSVALQGDINKKLSDALPVYLSVVVGLSLLLLIVAFRSILVPLKATLGFLLSVLAMFGAIVAVFQWGWLGIAEAPGPIVSFIPIIATGILFGLAMDYEFFLVSGMHEAYSHGTPARLAVTEGFGAGSKVVTAAAIIMVSVFGGFITNHDATIQSIGLGLAIGILIDAFIVRMTIVPAVMTLLGERAWWLPAWLDKRLPHLSIEGESDKK